MDKVFIIAIYSFWIPSDYDQCLIGTVNDWSKFEINKCFFRNFSKSFFSHDNNNKDDNSDNDITLFIIPKLGKWNI